MDKISARPIGDRVMIEMIVKRKQGGIEIPDIGLDDLTGKVVAVGEGLIGPDGQAIPLDICVGDVVLTERGMGTSIIFGGKEYFMFNIKHIVGVIE